MKRHTTLYSLNSTKMEQENSFSTDLRKNSPTVSPSDTVIRNLINYSKSLVILKTLDTGIIRLVMN